MTMSTPTLREAARLLEQNILLDTVQIYDRGAPVTVGINVTVELTPVGQPVPGLVQTTTLQGAVESRVADTYSIKVAAGTPLVAGQVVKLLNSRTEFDLVGKEFLVDKVSLNGAATIRKAIANEYHVVNQEGKSELS